MTALPGEQSKRGISQGKETVNAASLSACSRVAIGVTFMHSSRSALSDRLNTRAIRPVLSSLPGPGSFAVRIEEARFSGADDASAEAPSFLSSAARRPRRLLPPLAKEVKMSGPGCVSVFLVGPPSDSHCPRLAAAFRVHESQTIQPVAFKHLSSQSLPIQRQKIHGRSRPRRNSRIRGRFKLFVIVSTIFLASLEFLRVISLTSKQGKYRNALHGGLLPTTRFINPLFFLVAVAAYNRPAPAQFRESP